jgi:hypothetical protein
MHPLAARSQVSRHVSQWTAARYVALGQWGFATGVAICVALHPGFVLHGNEGGISDYGVHAKTALPYYLALAVAALGATLGATYARDARQLARNFRRLLMSYAVLITLTLASTIGYTLDRTQRDLHVGIGSALTFFELASSLWMCHERRADGGLLLVQVVGCALGALTIAGTIHLLFVSEILTGVTFAVVLFRTTRELSRPHP